MAFAVLCIGLMFGLMVLLCEACDRMAAYIAKKEGY